MTDRLYLISEVAVILRYGWHTGNVDDLIICGVKGELYPCKPDIFAATYEYVE